MNVLPNPPPRMMRLADLKQRVYECWARLSTYNSAVIQPEIKEQLERLAMLERRSLSQLAAIILEEAVRKAEAEGKIPVRE